MEELLSSLHLAVVHTMLYFFGDDAVDQLHEDYENVRLPIYIDVCE